MITILSVLGAIFSLGGNVAIAKKKKAGWLIWIAGNIAWIGVNFLGDFNLSMVLMYVAYLGINIKGFIDWSKQEKT
jgi:nicotinamide riboside transporter PnuC